MRLCADTWIHGTAAPMGCLERCIPSRGVQRRRKQPWFTRIELPPPQPRVSRDTKLLAVA